MPAPRTYEGIKMAEYSTDNSTWTEITNLVIEDSGVVFEGQSDNSNTNYYGGKYAGPESRVYTANFLNRTVYDTLKSNHDSDTGIYYRWTLDNDELHTTTIGVLPEDLKPVDFGAQVQGRGDKHMLQVRILKELITETTA